MLWNWSDGNRAMSPGVTENESRDVGGQDNSDTSTVAVIAVTNEGLDHWDSGPQLPRSSCRPVP